MADISANNLDWLRLVVKMGKHTVPALVYSKLKALGYVSKVEGETAGRGKTVVTATLAGKQAAV